MNWQSDMARQVRSEIDSQRRARNCLIAIGVLMMITAWVAV